jgi:hypothetical protein
MKKNLLTILFSILFLQAAFSQDTIIKRSGEEVQGKVTEISVSEVRYSRKDNPDVMMVLPKNSVFMIRYENGTKEVFEETTTANELQQLPTAPSPGPTRNITPEPATDKISAEQLYIKGRNDAGLYYKGYKGAGTATLLTTLLFSPAGLVTAIATSATPPTKHNLDYPDANLFAQPDYARGYIQKARKVKSGKVWTNFGIGFGALLVLSVIVSSNGQ